MRLPCRGQWLFCAAAGVIALHACKQARQRHNDPPSDSNASQNGEAPADETPPIISTVAPADNATLTTATFDVTFAVDETASCRWSFLDQAYADMTFGCDMDALSVICAVADASEGDITVSIACSDAVDNAHSAATNLDLTYFVDSLAPELTPLSPPGGYVGASAVTVTTTTSESSDCRWSLDVTDYASMTETCAGDASVTCDVTSLAVGGSTVTVACRDAYGHESMVSDTYDQNDGPPAVVILDPSEGTAIWEEEFALYVTLSEPGSCRWSLADVDYDAMGQGADCLPYATFHVCAISGYVSGTLNVFIACADTDGAADTAQSSDVFVLEAEVVPDLTPQLVRDINLVKKGFYPTCAGTIEHPALGELLFCSGSADGVTGLWRTDGTGFTFLKAVTAGTDNRGNAVFIGLGERAVFVADDGNGTAFWTTDGTDTGTVRLQIDTNVTTPSQLTRVGGDDNRTIIFSGYDATHGYEPWLLTFDVDWNPSVSLIADLNVGPDNSTPYFHLVGDAVYLRATGDWDTTPDDENASLSDVGREPWIFDAQGLRLVADIYPGTNGSEPRDFTQHLGTVYFKARNQASDYELWETNGTTAVRAADIRTGTSGSDPAGFLSFDNLLLFQAANSGVGTELYAWDDANGTVRLVKDIYSGSKSANPAGLTRFGNKVYFAAEINATPSTYLHSTDGSTAGTELVRTEHNATLRAYELRVWNNALYFSGDDGSGGQLWRMDANGSVAAVTSLTPAPGSGANTAQPVGDRLVFPISDAATGTDVFALDANLTVHAIGVASDATASSEPRFLTVYGDRVYFQADDKLYGQEAWVTDATSGAATLFFDALAGSGSSGPHGFTVAGEALFFRTVNGSLFDLWCYREIFAEPVLLDTFKRLESISMAAVGEELYLLADPDSTTNPDLWSASCPVAESDPPVLTLRSDVNPGNAWSFEFTEFNNEVYGAGSVSNAISCTDGSAIGTANGLVRFDDNDTCFVDYNGSGNVVTTPHHLVVFSDALYFLATSNGSDGLYRFDGTQVSLVMETDPNSTAIDQPSLFAFDDRLFFLAANANDGVEWWQSDGATESLFVDVRPGPASSNPWYAAVFDRFFCFSAQSDDGNDTGQVGREPWCSDGTAEGTFLLADMYPGPQESDSGWSGFIEFRGQIYFSATDDTHGMELRRWNPGRVAPQLVADLNVGTGGSMTSEPIVTGPDALYFAAYHPLYGNELWAYGPLWVE